MPPRCGSGVERGLAMAPDLPWNAACPASSDRTRIAVPSASRGRRINYSLEIPGKAAGAILPGRGGPGSGQAPGRSRGPCGGSPFGQDALEEVDGGLDLGGADAQGRAEADGALAAAQEQEAAAEGGLYHLVAGGRVQGVGAARL